MSSTTGSSARAASRLAALVASLPPYVAPSVLSGGEWAGHLQTILPTLFRGVPEVRFRRERIDTPDGDFLDLDWARPASSVPHERPLAVVSHGLEGSTDRAYVRGMVRAFQRRGWDVLAWNFRTCSGEMNRTVRAYHSGATDDLQTVLDRVFTIGYTRVGLVGFSLGGNLTLKYLGEQAGAVDSRLLGAVAISVPVDLAASSTVMERASRRVYMLRFLRSLEAKMIEKAKVFPEMPDPDPIRSMRTFREFDDYVTAPLHGYDGAEDYWRRASALPELPKIRIPTLLVNARNDPFLAESCYPEAAARGNPQFHLLTPADGGHVGFVRRGGEFWSETVAAMFLSGVVEPTLAQADTEPGESAESAPRRSASSLAGPSSTA